MGNGPPMHSTPQRSPACLSCHNVVPDSHRSASLSMPLLRDVSTPKAFLATYELCSLASGRRAAVFTDALPAAVNLFNGQGPDSQEEEAGNGTGRGLGSGLPFDWSCSACVPRNLPWRVSSAGTEGQVPEAPADPALGRWGRARRQSPALVLPWLVREVEDRRGLPVPQRFRLCLPASEWGLGGTQDARELSGT